MFLWTFISCVLYESVYRLDLSGTRFYNVWKSECVTEDQTCSSSAHKSFDGIFCFWHAANTIIWNPSEIFWHKNSSHHLNHLTLKVYVFMDIYFVCFIGVFTTWTGAFIKFGNQSALLMSQLSSWILFGGIFCLRDAAISKFQVCQTKFQYLSI